MEHQTLREITLLYVEDENDIRKSLSRFLGKRVKRLYVAENGAQGLEMFREHRPDIVVTDIQMPEMNGLEMATRIRALVPETPILITTAFSDAEFLIKSIEIGIDQYLKKPLRANLLLESIANVANRILQQRRIEEQNHIIQTILDNYPGFIITCTDSQVRYMNRAFLRYLGYEQINDFLADQQDLNPFLLAKDGAFYEGAEGFSWVRQVLQHPEQEFIVYLTSSARLMSEAEAYMVQVKLLKEAEDEESESSYLVSLTDITALERERQHFQELSMRDPLTDIYNRKIFEEELTREIERVTRYGGRFCLVMFDIDHFKRVNDTFGHQVGDYVIKQIVALVGRRIRGSDIFGRYGGEEFVICLPNTSTHDGTALTESLRSIIAQAEFSYVDGPITCSFGLAEYQADETVRDIFTRADSALYRAKNAGRNRVEVAVVGQQPPAS